MRPYAALPLIFPVLMLAIAAAADPVVVSQRAREFEPRDVAVKVGEPVLFRNDDNIVHNVYSATPGHAFDLKGQPPGAQASVSFDAAGLVDVRCAIHPKMRLSVRVE